MGCKPALKKPSWSFERAWIHPFLQEVGGGEAMEPLEEELVEEVSSRLASREWLSL